MNVAEQPEIETSANTADISDLFRRIELREKNALFELYEHTSGLLFGLTLKILGNRTDAEEALLDIYASVWKGPVPHNVNYPPFAWLVTIARAHALSRLYETGRVYSPAPEAEDTVEKKASDREQKDGRIRFEALAPIQRKILDWAFCSGLSAWEIAEKTRVSPGAVKTHARIGLNRLGKEPELPKCDNEPADEDGGDSL